MHEITLKNWSHMSWSE